MEFLLGGVAACGAGFFTNPLEVVKTRMQLQGELKARGMYTVHYRNVFHAFYAIGKVDGVLALQSGLVPALWYQFFMNGFRLGAYQMMQNLGITKNKDGDISFPKSVCAGAIAGTLGATVGSPIYMVSLLSISDLPCTSGFFWDLFDVPNMDSCVLIFKKFITVLFAWPYLMLYMSRRKV